MDIVARYRLNSLFDYEHTSFKPLLCPFLCSAIIIVQADMAELVDNRSYGGIATLENSKVVVVYRIGCDSDLFSEEWRRCGCSRDVGVR